MSQPPSLYDVLMQRYWSCKTVARVLCLVAREWLGSCQSWSSKVSVNVETNPHLYTMFWCRDIGLAKRLLGYSVWLLGSDLAASNHDTPKASCQYEWYKPTPTPLWHSECKIFLCEFWLLRCSTMVARAWPVSVEVIQDWLLAAPSQTSPPSCFYDTSILRYPFDLFQWKSMGRVAKVL